MRIRILELTLLALVLFAAAGSAFGQFDSSVWYRITAQHSGKCLAVANGVNARANGDRVIQWDCIESETNQKWQVIPVGNGFYKIIAKHSLLALDVFGGTISQRDGAVVDQWAYLQGDNQKWGIRCEGYPYYRIIAKHSGKSLDINGGPAATGNGPYAQQWASWDGANQKFMFTVSLLDLGMNHATGTVCPSTEDQARLGVSPYTTDTSLRRRTSFRVGEAVVLTAENNTAPMIYFAEAINPAQLIREEGLQVERLITNNNNTFWVPVFPSGICGPREIRRDNGDGTGSVVTISYLSPTRFRELRYAIPFARRWTVPSLIGPGTYRLSFVYYGRNDGQGASNTVCSQPFVVR